MKKYTITATQYNQWVATDWIDEEAIEWIAYKIVKGIELSNMESSIHIGTKSWVDTYIIDWQKRLDI